MGQDSSRFYKTRYQSDTKMKKKKTLVLTFPFCIPVSTGGSWGSGHCSFSLTRTASEEDSWTQSCTISQDTEIQANDCRLREHPFSFTLLTHTLHMEKPRSGTNRDIVNMSIESPTECSVLDGFPKTRGKNCKNWRHSLPRSSDRDSPAMERPRSRMTAEH